MAVAAIALILILLAYRTRGLNFRWNLFWSTLDQVRWGWLAVSICLILLSNVGRALRWQVMLRPFGRTLGVWRLTSDTAIGLTSTVLLGRVGEVVRPYLIAVQTGLPLSSQAAAWLLERTLDLLVVLLFFAFALLWVPMHSRHFGPEIQTVLATGGYIFGAMGALCLALLLAFRDPARRAKQRLLSALTFLPAQPHARAERMLEAFSQGVDCTRDPRSLALLVGLHRPGVGHHCRKLQRANARVPGNTATGAHGCAGVVRFHQPGQRGSDTRPRRGSASGYGGCTYEDLRDSFRGCVRGGHLALGGQLACDRALRMRLRLP